MSESEMTVIAKEDVARAETWDAVAETYHIELEEDDYRLADTIEQILNRQGLLPGDSLIEMGCGSGHISACLALKGYKVTLVDFSPVALEKAKQTFAHYQLEGNFVQGDLLELDSNIPMHDYAWNSGVMEHFGDKEIAILMSNIARCAQKGVLYLVPNSTSVAYLLMRARLMASDEWMFGNEYLREDYDTILKQLGYEYIEKVYVSTPDISAYQMWRAEKKQGNISELYRVLSTEKMLPEQEAYLVGYFATKCSMPKSESTSYTGSAQRDTRLFDLIAKKIGYAELKDQNQWLCKKIEELEASIEKKSNEIESLQGLYDETVTKNEQYENELQQMMEKYDSLLEQNEIQKGELKQCERKLEESWKKYNSLLEQNEILQNNCEMGQAVIQQKDEYIRQVRGYCNHFATGKLMQLNHFLFRLKGQVLRGDREDRKDFKTWLKGKINKTNRDIGEGKKYNPWMFVNQVLDDALKLKCVPVAERQGQQDGTELSFENSAVGDKSLTQITKNALKQKYTKYDVIILSVIDYHFRHQRPQHFATRFAENGHRVFYVNANFVRSDSVTRELQNLYLADFSCKNYNAIYAMNGQDTLQWMKDKFDNLITTWAIRDAVIVVDYPNWVYGAEYMREKYGFKIVTDYMDDYTGFLGTAEDFLKDNCIKLLRDSDLVVASSQFLHDVACKHTDTDKITIIRNGTEVDHFYQAIHMEKEKERKVIGYYGAVAHWFAWEKVCYLAKNMPECDIVIVGEVTEHREKLEKYSNIKLLGEKSYTELPRYLAKFDVCLIPFDTSTDLIKATNPVKFYEYLSAGKKVVATEIPELKPFENQYVYMSNDQKQFAAYVKLCLEGKDILQDKEQCIAFAKENDWQKRFEAFSDACKKKVPMVSVVVLTYNNLELNKNCIGSILDQTAYANYELIIVDNQSTDGTVDYLNELKQKNIPGVKIILNDVNTGFAGGNNIAIKASEGEYVLLLNNDTVVTRGWLTAMVKHLENNPKYGMCNPVTNSIGNECMIVAQYTNQDELMEFSYSYTSKYMGGEYTDVDRLPLFATLIKRKVIEEIGLLGEEYKVGMFEDDDYTERVLQADYEIVIVEDAFIHHVNNASFKKIDDEQYKKIFEENKKIFEQKWNKKWVMPKYREGVNWDSNIGTHL